MRYIFILTFLIWASQTQNISGNSLDYPLPSQDELLSYVVTDERESQSLKVIEEVFSNPDVECRVKVKFIQCYIGKLKVFVFFANRQTTKKMNEINPELAENAVKFTRQLGAAQIQQAQRKINLKKLKETSEFLKEFKNPKATAKKNKQVRRLIRENLLPRANAELKKKYDNFEKAIQKPNEMFEKLDVLRSQRLNKVNDLKKKRKPAPQKPKSKQDSENQPKQNPVKEQPQQKQPKQSSQQQSSQQTQRRKLQIFELDLKQKINEALEQVLQNFEVLNVDGIQYILDEDLEGEISDAEDSLEKIENSIFAIDSVIISIYGQNEQLQAQLSVLVGTAEQQQTLLLEQAEMSQRQAESVVNEVAAQAGISSHPTTAYIQAQRREFQCLGAQYNTITNDGQVIVTTLSASQFQAYVQIIFGIGALPSFSVDQSVELRSLSVFTPGWEQEHGNPIDDFQLDPPCCDEPTQLITGVISEVLGNAFRIIIDDGPERMIDVTVCSKLYKVGVQLGDRIVFNGLTVENSLYISTAIIYQSS